MSFPEKKIIIHIGTHKTGTSSFQKLLHENAPVFIENEIYPVPNFDQKDAASSNYNNIVVSHLNLREGLLTGARMRGDVKKWTAIQKKEIEESLVRYIHNLPHRTVLISAEVFCFYRTQQEQVALSKLFHRIGRKVEIILLTRDLQEWHESWQDQLQKDPIVSTVLNRLPPKDRIDAPWYFDTKAIIKFWSSLGALHHIEYQNGQDTNLAYLKSLGYRPQNYTCPTH